MKDYRCPICGEKLEIIETREYDIIWCTDADYYAYGCERCNYKQYCQYTEAEENFMIRDMEEFIKKVNQLKESK